MGVTISPQHLNFTPMFSYSKERISVMFDCIVKCPVHCSGHCPRGVVCAFLRISCHSLIFHSPNSPTWMTPDEPAAPQMARNKQHCGERPRLKRSKTGRLAKCESASKFWKCLQLLSSSTFHQLPLARTANNLPWPTLLSSYW